MCCLVSRELDEWIGAKPDTAIPPRVRLRVLLAHGGKCYKSGRKIMPGDKWQIDHVRALINAILKALIAAETKEPTP